MAEAADEAPAHRKRRVYPRWLCLIVYLLTRNTILVFSILYFRLSRKGLRNVPRRGAVLFVANHCSHMDPPLLSLATGRPVTFLGKSDLFDIPFLGTYITLLGAFPVRRGEGDRGAIRTCVNLLKDGRALVIFPEGTRSPDGKPQEPKLGAAMVLSMAPETTVIPVRIEGSFEAFGGGKKFPLPKKISMTMGKPFRLADLSDLPTVKKQLYHEIGSRIMAKIADATP